MAHLDPSKGNREWPGFEQLLRIAQRNRSAFLHAGVRRGWKRLARAAQRALHPHGAPRTA